MSNICSTLLKEGIELKKLVPFTKPFSIDLKTEEEKPVKLTAAQKICNIIVDHEMVGFVDLNNITYLYLSGDGIIVPLQSEQVRNYFLSTYLESAGKTCAPRVLSDVLATVEALCKKQKARHSVFRRVAMKDNKIYLDLCDEKNSIVEIDSDGYRIAAYSPVIFLRHGDIAPLPIPDDSVSKDKIIDLKEFINCPDFDNFRLVVCYLVHLFFPENYEGGKVILAIEGQAGSAKSTFTRIIKSLADPSSNDLLSVPHSKTDLSLYAKSQWVLTFDNMSGIDERLSNELCKLATNAGSFRRKLYCDEDAFSSKMKRCLIINGISEYMQREDLLDRCLMFVLPVIKGSRIPESLLWKNFNSEKTKIFSALLNIVSGALKMLPEASVTEDFRMADFAKIGCAVERYMGWNEGEDFCQIYKRNLERMASNNLTQNVVAASLIYYLKKCCPDLSEGFSYCVTPHELFKDLKNLNLQSDFANPEFPNSLSEFSKKVYQLAPSFKKVGITITKKHSGNRTITMAAEPNEIDSKLF